MNDKTLAKEIRRASILAALRIVHSAWAAAWPLLCDWREHYDPDDHLGMYEVERLLDACERRIKSR